MKIMRDHRIPKMIYEWMPKGQRKRGRVKLTWVRGIIKAIKERRLEIGAGGREIGIDGEYHNSPKIDIRLCLRHCKPW